MADGWFPGATRREPNGTAKLKHGYPGFSEPGPKSGLVCHSMTGSVSAALSRLDGTDRASWTWSNPKEGPLLQHFPQGYHTWASGAVIPNTRFTSCEHEGGPPGNESEPLTENQINNLVTLLRWLHDEQGWAGYVRNIELWEHREMIRFGAAPTACPSNRIPWAEVQRRLVEEHMPTPEYEELTKRIDDLTKALAAGAEHLQGEVNDLNHNLAATNKLVGDGLTNHETRLKAGGH